MENTEDMAIRLPQGPEINEIQSEIVAASGDQEEVETEADANQPLNEPNETDTTENLPASDEEEEMDEGEPERSQGIEEGENGFEAAEADKEKPVTKPEFYVEIKDPPGTALRICALLSEQGVIYQRGNEIVTLQRSMARGRLNAVQMSPDDIAAALHAVAQPYVIKTGRDGSNHREEIAIPERTVRMCSTREVVAKLPPLRGIVHTPIIGDNGNIRCVKGYDSTTGLFCYDVPVVLVRNRAERRHAESALRRLRERIRTFVFADGIFVEEAGFNQPVIDVDQPPGADESSFLTAVITAACRASLGLVPGLLVTAPYLSGAGAGKGKLVRFIGEVAYGLQPSALTPGHNAEEMDKRLASELMTATPIILLDNVNATELRSNLLASAITENPAQVRIMRTNKLAPLNPLTFICVTGNGLSVTEDLRRRFLEVQLNPGLENPEARLFSGDFLADARRDRAEILTDIFTIVQWGMEQGEELAHGVPLGSFEAWGRLCRDPLLALGCMDPVAEIARRHASDSQRSEVTELFETFWHHHGAQPMEANDLHQEVWNALAPYGESRQHVAQKLKSLDGTICGGFRFKLIPKTGRWSRNKYKLENLQ